MNWCADMRDAKFGKNNVGSAIRSSGAEYLIYVVSISDQQESIGMRYDEDICLEK